MAEVYIFGQILSAENFREPNLFCRWNIQAGTKKFYKAFRRKIFISFLLLPLRLFVEICRR